MAKTIKKTGRPTKYTDVLASSICEAIATSSNGLRTICSKNKTFPSLSTIMKWLSENKEFSEQYTRAREAQADFLADEILTISDNSTGDNKAFVGINRIHRAKLQIESRKWIASKLKPKKYGDKIDVTTQGDSINKSPTIIKLSNGTEINLE